MITKLEEGPSWAERTRLEFIERVLYWRGWINRADLIAGFGISPPQATNDLVTYSTLSEGGCAYNVRRKRYEAGPDFRPQLTTPEMWEDLQRLSPVFWGRDEGPLLASPELPTRRASAEVMQRVSRAIFAREALEIRYLSAHSGTAEVRWISPRALADDGLRLHVRAFCHRDRSFKDFNLSRIEEVRQSTECPHRAEVDENWQNFEELIVGVSPELSDLQKQALAMDYGMTDGVVRVRVRRALSLYTQRRLGFVTVDSFPALNERRELMLLGIEPLWPDGPGNQSAGSK